MLAFGLVMFAIGVLLANVASAPVFAVVALVLVVAGFAQGIHVGWPVGHAAFAAIVSFICGQVGYVAGIGLRALVAAKLGRADKAETAKTAQETGFDKSSAAPLNGGQ
jgi:uncharacterized membrane protein